MLCDKRPDCSYLYFATDREREIQLVKLTNGCRIENGRISNMDWSKIPKTNYDDNGVPCMSTSLFEEKVKTPAKSETVAKKVTKASSIMAKFSKACKSRQEANEKLAEEAPQKQPTEPPKKTVQEKPVSPPKKSMSPEKAANEPAKRPEKKKAPARARKKTETCLEDTSLSDETIDQVSRVVVRSFTRCLIEIGQAIMSVKRVAEAHEDEPPKKRAK